MNKENVLQENTVTDNMSLEDSPEHDVAEDDESFRTSDAAQILNRNHKSHDRKLKKDVQKEVATMD